MLFKHLFIETIGFILILSLAGCSNHAAAASLQEDAVEFHSNSEMTPLSTAEMKLAETPVIILSTLSSPKQSNVDYLRESATPTTDSVQPTSSLSNPGSRSRLPYQNLRFVLRSRTWS